VRSKIDRLDRLATEIQSLYGQAALSEPDLRAFARVIDRLYMDRDCIKHSIGTEAETTISYIRYLHGLMNESTGDIYDDMHSDFPQEAIQVESERRILNAREEAEAQHLTLVQEEYDARQPYIYKRIWDENGFFPERPANIFATPGEKLDWGAWEALHLYDAMERFPWLRLKDTEEAVAFFRSPQCFLNVDMGANSLEARAFSLWISCEFERKAPDDVHDAYTAWYDDWVEKNV
jgi:hypothetical protein